MKCRLNSCSEDVRFKNLRLCNKHGLRWKRSRRLSSSRREWGEGTIKSSGYLATVISGKIKYLHVRIAEKALGRVLVGEEEVHHFDEDKLNNDNGNLIICPDRAYHMLLHVRQRALAACGDADWKKCFQCQVWSEPAGMLKYPSRSRKGFRYKHHRMFNQCVI